MVSKERATTEALPTLCKVVSHSVSKERRVLVSLSLAKHICEPHSVVPLTDIITVNASRSKVTESALALSNHSLCICEDQELLLSSARLSHFKLRRCCCILIDLFCLLSPALLFPLVDCCYR